MAKPAPLDVFTPTANPGSRLRYPSILAMIEQGIATGRLKPGDALPTQRDLAQVLRTAVGTVSRAYSEGERLGLIVGQVGRGTYVSAHRHINATPGMPRSDVIDLTINRPPNEPASAAFAHALRVLSKRRDVSDLLGNEPANGWLRHRVSACKWISGRGILVSADNVLPCNGVQHGLSVVLAALSTAGDVVATERLNYPGVALLAKLYRLKIAGIPIDSDGLRPDALDRICEREEVKILLCSPTLHNPTTATMNVARRQEIVAIARRRGLTIIENDILGMMAPRDWPSLATLAPECCFYLTGLSKVVATGLRLGFIVPPSAVLARVTTALHSTTWMPPPLMCEIFTLLVEDGSIGRIIESHREEARVRGDIACRVLSSAGIDARSAGYYAWLRLPDQWREGAFVEAARSKGVAVTSGSVFCIGDKCASPNAVRIGLGSVNSRQRVEQALGALASIVRPARPRGKRAL